MRNCTKELGSLRTRKGLKELCAGLAAIPLLSRHTDEEENNNENLLVATREWLGECVKGVLLLGHD